jgi:Icc-related predicted phosphoesterase
LTKILAVGDTHGNDRFLTQAIKLAKKDLEADTILQAGDFGFWEHYKEGVSFLKWISRQLVEKGITLHWIDGNHENHTMLRQLYGPGGERHKPTEEGFWEIRENLFYIPRGTRWNWGGVDFMGLGGAYSVDKAWRTEGKSWWPEETITQDEVAYAVRPGNVDVIVSHDAPDGVPIPIFRADEKDKFPESRANRQQVLKVVQRTRPVLLIHGHYHCRYTDVFTWGNGRTLVEGLGCDMDWDDRAYVSLDTDDLLAMKQRLADR